MLNKQAGFMEDFGKEYGYASPLLGLGLGTLAGVGINRFLLGNKSLKSNLIAGALGAAGGTGLGMYLGNNTHTAEKQEEVAEEAAKNKLEGYVSRFNKETPEAAGKSLNDRQAMFIDWAKKTLPFDEAETVVKDYSPRFIDSKAAHIGEQALVGVAGAAGGNIIAGSLRPKAINLPGTNKELKFTIKHTQGKLGRILRGGNAGEPVFELNSGANGAVINDLRKMNLTDEQKRAVAKLVNRSHNFIPGLSTLGGLDNADRELLKEWSRLGEKNIPWLIRDRNGKKHFDPIAKLKLVARREQRAYANQKNSGLARILSKNKFLSLLGAGGRGIKNSAGRLTQSGRASSLGATLALLGYNAFVPDFRESYSDKNNDIRSLLGN